MSQIKTEDDRSAGAKSVTLSGFFMAKLSSKLEPKVVFSVRLIR